MGNPDHSIPSSLPYWLVNVPRENWPAECPEYLLGLSEKDTKHLAVKDEEYRLLNWEEVRYIVANNALDSFFRVPSELRRYRWYCWTLIQSHGSVMNYMLRERLKWTNLEPRENEPFASEDDYRILRNDWPYGMDPRIVHLVIWTKNIFDADPATGELTSEAWVNIDDFVHRTFGSNIPSDKTIWFKNPVSLRSVRAVEHFHVMLFNPNPAFIAHITNGDIAMCERVSRPGSDHL